MLTDVGCVVVHHQNFPGVLKTVRAILAGGVPANRFILVDNSEDPILAASLEADLPPGIRFLTEENLGYGHAANTGIHELQSTAIRPKYILISTHEAVPESNAIATMVQALCVSGAQAVGPTLIDDERGGRIWSTGGELSRFLNIPFHIRWEEQGRTQSSSPVKRTWLDGAFCLYDADVLSSLEFRKEYFLYFEEVDLHMRIQKAGGKVVWSPTAQVAQVSSGIPPYYLTRNMYIFQSQHGNSTQLALASLYSLLRFAMRTIIKERAIPEFRDLGRGLLDARRLERRRKSGPPVWVPKSGIGSPRDIER